MKSASIRFTDVTKRYGDVAAVDRITFTIAAGTLVTLLGPSGCGKTTTLRLIAGLELPTSGVVTIGDRDVTHVPASERDVSMVFQSYALFPHMNVLENVRYGLIVSKLPRAQADERARAALQTVGLDGYDARLPSELSGGQQQRVAVARALASRPAIIFADEPTGNLDSKSGVEVLRLLRQSVTENGQNIVMVTHDANAASYADRVIFLADGQIVDELADPTADAVLDKIKGLDLSAAASAGAGK